MILNHELTQAQWVELAVLDSLFMHLQFMSTSFSKYVTIKGIFEKAKSTQTSESLQEQRKYCPGRGWCRGSHASIARRLIRLTHKPRAALSAVSCTTIERSTRLAAVTRIPAQKLSNTQQQQQTTAANCSSNSSSSSSSSSSSNNSSCSSILAAGAESITVMK